MIHIESNWESVDKELERLVHLPGPKGITTLDGVLAMAYAETQAAVHIDTGSLKESVKVESTEKGQVWEGDLDYGGVSTGVNSPVDYAIYEKARGGSHDFMAPVEKFDQFWTEAVKEVLSP